MTTYLQEPVATAPAQQLWDQSAILEKFREQKVIRTRYGYEEVETGYRTWLGVCENEERMWSGSQSRAEYMAQKAMRETPLQTLDVNGWRAFMHLFFKYSTNDKLLRPMHTLRAKSRHQSAAAAPNVPGGLPSMEFLVRLLYSIFFVCACCSRRIGFQPTARQSHSISNYIDEQHQNTPVSDSRRSASSTLLRGVSY